MMENVNIAESHRRSLKSSMLRDVVEASIAECARDAIVCSHSLGPYSLA